MFTQMFTCMKGLDARRRNSERLRAALLALSTKQRKAQPAGRFMNRWPAWLQLHELFRCFGAKRLAVGRAVWLSTVAAHIHVDTLEAQSGASVPCRFSVPGLVPARTVQQRARRGRLLGFGCSPSWVCNVARRAVHVPTVYQYRASVWLNRTTTVPSPGQRRANTVPFARSGTALARRWPIPRSS
jgi:hypothetical protein